MINGSFVFGMDDDDQDVFRRTVDWAIEQGITTATFHIQTPYPGTKLFAQMQAAERIVTYDWDLYDTRHVVYRSARLTPEALKNGYDWAYREFYRWPSIVRGSLSHGTVKHREAFLLCRRVEEVRAAVGLCHPGEATGGDDAGPRGGAVERSVAWRPSEVRSPKSSPETSARSSRAVDVADMTGAAACVEEESPCH